MMSIFLKAWVIFSLAGFADPACCTEDPMTGCSDAASGRAFSEPKAGRGNLRMAALFDPSVPRFVCRPTHVMMSEIQSA
jgi:hypothetical protein